MKFSRTESLTKAALIMTHFIPNLFRQVALLFIGILFAATSLFASAANINENELLTAVEAVVEEHKIYATCLALDSVSARLAQHVWSEEVQSGTEALRALKPSPQLVARFTAAIQQSKLLDEDMPLKKAIAYCRKNEAQLRQLMVYGHARLTTAIASASKPKTK